MLGQPLRIEDVDPSAGEAATGECVRQGVQVHDGPSGAIDQERGRTHQGESARVHQSAGGVGEGDMECDCVAAPKKILEASQLGTVGRNVGRRGGSVRDEDAHPEAPATSRHGAPDVTEADHSQHRAGQTVKRHPHRDVPTARAYRCVVHGRAPGKGEEEGDGMFGDLIDAVGGDVRDRNAPLSGRVDRDVVYPDTVAADHPQPRPGANDGRRDVTEAGEDRVGTRDQIDELLFVPGRGDAQFPVDRCQQPRLEVCGRARMVGHEHDRHLWLRRIWFRLTIDNNAYYKAVINIRPSARIRDDLDHRIELVSMDRHCDDITIALYVVGDGTMATVHSYSGRPSVAARLAWIAGAMGVVAGTRVADADLRTVGFACGTWHELAARRAFLEACKLDPSLPVEPRPLETNDGRTRQFITVRPLGGGAYRVGAVAEDKTAVDRAPAVAAGLVKLMDLGFEADDPTVVRFPCGAPHDELVGLLLPRAINVRAALRELETAASRGILVAPSAQDTPS